MFFDIIFSLDLRLRIAFPRRLDYNIFGLQEGEHRWYWNF
jgi:hypothetical protein